MSDTLTPLPRYRMTYLPCDSGIRLYPELRPKGQWMKASDVSRLEQQYEELERDYAELRLWAEQNGWLDQALRSSRVASLVDAKRTDR